MSYICQYYLIDRVPEFFVDGKNIRDWLRGVQGPRVKAVLEKLYQVTKKWK